MESRRDGIRHGVAFEGDMTVNKGSTGGGGGLIKADEPMPVGILDYIC